MFMYEQKQVKFVFVSDWAFKNFRISIIFNAIIKTTSGLLHG